jgi:hypothetical protein
MVNVLLKLLSFLLNAFIFSMVSDRKPCKRITMGKSRQRACRSPLCASLIIVKYDDFLIKQKNHVKKAKIWKLEGI